MNTFHLCKRQTGHAMTSVRGSGHNMEILLGRAASNVFYD